MLTMEPLYTAKYRRHPYRLIDSLRLLDEQRRRRGTTPTYAVPVGGAPRGYTDTHGRVGSWRGRGEMADTMFSLPGICTAPGR